MTETGTVKACVACGKNLNGQKRMKDSSGRYWCVECGTEDQRKKMLSSGGGNVCAACGETFPVHQLSKWGGKMLCTNCTQARSKGPSIGTKLSRLLGSGPANTGKLFKLVAVMVVLILLTIWRYATL